MEYITLDNGVKMLQEGYGVFDLFRGMRVLCQ